MTSDGVTDAPQAPEPPGDIRGRSIPPEKIGSLLSRLVDDTEHFVRAEVRLYRAQAIIRLIRMRAALMMAGVAAVLVLSTAIALQIGIILVLVPHVGRAAAVGIVVVASLATAWLLFRAAMNTLRKVTEVAPAKDDGIP